MVSANLRYFLKMINFFFYFLDQLLLNRAEKWAIVCSNYDELTILRNWLRSCKKSIDYFIERNGNLCSKSID